MDLLEKFVGLPSTSLKTARPTPSDVGILGFELYFPRSYVCQRELEQFDQVSGGKYTTGLGQSQMSFCDDSEDVCSMALSATSALLNNYKIDPKCIGFLEVGTETLIDKSKSVKTVLMDLFGGNQNSDIQGADVKNACFGGTQAFFHAVDWIHANYQFEERLAIVVCVDIAVYSPGAARCTGGAGAIAFLVGPQAPLVLERGLRGVFASNVHDFYKPIGGQCSEYAVVNGQKSVELYLSAVDATYSVYRQKCLNVLGQNRSVVDFCAVLFHSPFTKIAQKAFGRMVFRDFERGENYTKALDSSKVEEHRGVPLQETLGQEFSTATMQFSQSLMEHKLNAHLEFNKRLGNMYTPSVYAQLLNLIYNHPTAHQLNNQKVLMFSYGSGCIAAMYSISIHTSSTIQQHSYLQMVNSAEQAHQRLNQRVQQSPQQFSQALERREALVASQGAYTLNSASQTRFPGAFYLIDIDEKCCRSYCQIEK